MDPCAGRGRNVETGGAAIEIVNASQWPIERLAPYMSGILEQMGRLADRFPDDVTMGALFAEVMNGRRTLWLILEDGKLLAIALTTVRTIDATGAKILKLHDLAGNGMRRFSEELRQTLEGYARENGCHMTEIEGREGWKPLLTKFGYSTRAMLFRKAL